VLVSTYGQTICRRKSMNSCLDTGTYPQLYPQYWSKKVFQESYKKSLYENPSIISVICFRVVPSRFLHFPSRLPHFLLRFRKMPPPFPFARTYPQQTCPSKQATWICHGVSPCHSHCSPRHSHVSSENGNGGGKSVSQREHFPSCERTSLRLWSIRWNSGGIWRLKRQQR